MEDCLDTREPVSVDSSAVPEAPLIKADIINQVADDASITKVKAVEAVDAVFEAMKNAMRDGERIELRGFGVFQVKPRKKGIGRNPRTGREVRIPPGKTIRFKPGKNLRDLT
jgi:DNA-binding protein HU-beta